MSYNVENLYDLKDDPTTEDDDYTPDGEKKWTEKRYNKKLHGLAKVISSINKENLPGIIGLCEIENKKVLNDLVLQESIRSVNYQYVHENGKNNDGLDVALLYNADQFKYLSHQSIPINSNVLSDTNIKNILYVKGVALATDTLHLLINHWVSRNSKNTKEKHQIIAKVLDNIVDSIIDINNKSKIVILGDFNDEPTDKSIFETLNANNKRKNTGKKELYNLYYDMHNMNNKGTYSKKGKWYMFDQIIVSQQLVDTKKGLFTEYNSGKIFKPIWLLVNNPKADDLIPKKTYGGNTYLGGLSNHLPVYTVFKIKK